MAVFIMSRYKHKGFTLIELLVAVMVLSIGLLGIAAMQVETLSKSSESYYKSVAANLANDMIDVMRSNPIGVENDFYHAPNSNNDSLTLSCFGETVLEASLQDDYQPNTITNHPVMLLVGMQSENTLASAEVQTVYSNTGCTPEQMAYHDLFLWRSQVGQNLPSGTAQICRTSNPGTDISNLNCNQQGSLYVLSINWIDREGTAQNYRVSFQP